MSHAPMNAHVRVMNGRLPRHKRRATILIVTPKQKQKTMVATIPTSHAPANLEVVKLGGAIESFCFM